MRISDWSSDVCSSDLLRPPGHGRRALEQQGDRRDRAGRPADHDDTRIALAAQQIGDALIAADAEHFVRLDQPVARAGDERHARHRSEEHTSELQSLMRTSYAVFCLKKKKTTNTSKKHTPAKLV